MITEYRNSMYVVLGFQLSEISIIIDTITAIRYVLCSDNVSREVIGAAVELAQNALNNTLDYILEYQKVETIPNQNEQKPGSNPRSF